MEHVAPCPHSLLAFRLSSSDAAVQWWHMTMDRHRHTRDAAARARLLWMAGAYRRDAQIHRSRARQIAQRFGIPMEGAR